MKVLLVNDAPNSCYQQCLQAFTDLGISAEIVVVRNSKAALEALANADEIDIVFMDYDLQEQTGNTLASGLIQKFVDAGFGVGKKPLIAACRQSQKTREAMMRAGCSHQTDWVMYDPKQIVKEIAGK